MINYIHFAIVVIVLCLFWMSHKKKDGSHVNQLPPILIILVLITIGVFFSTSDEATLSGIPTVRVSHENIKSINPNCEARLNMGGTYKNKNKFFLTEATVLDDLQNFIENNNGSCEFVIYDSEDNVVFSYIFKEPDAIEILGTYKEWKSTGKFDLNTVRVEFFNIFYVNQV